MDLQLFDWIYLVHWIYSYLKSVLDLFGSLDLQLFESFCVSVNTMSDRLTMFSSAQNRQLGLRHCSWVCLDFICLDLFLSDGLLALLECLCVVLVVVC